MHSTRSIPSRLKFSGSSKGLSNSSAIVQACTGPVIKTKLVNLWVQSNQNSDIYIFHPHYANCYVKMLCIFPQIINAQKYHSTNNQPKYGRQVRTIANAYGNTHPQHAIKNMINTTSDGISPFSHLIHYKGNTP